jgi:hypothetical protein
MTESDNDSGTSVDVPERIADQSRIVGPVLGALKDMLR